MELESYSDRQTDEQQNENNIVPVVAMGYGILKMGDEVIWMASSTDYRVGFMIYDWSPGRNQLLGLVPFLYLRSSLKCPANCGYFRSLL